jgi:hypothetical protein
MLFDLGLKFECQERRNRMRELESGLFVVEKVGVQVVWRADFDKGEVVMEARNLERLGFVTFVLRPNHLPSCSTNSAVWCWAGKPFPQSGGPLRHCATVFRSVGQQTGRHSLGDTMPSTPADRMPPA